MEPLAESTTTAVIQSPIELINLTEWLFTLSDEEYKACSKAHIACGASRTADGKRMSINVEMIAGNLLVQHYIEDESHSDHCRVQSVSDSFSPMGRTWLRIIWELKLSRLSEASCELRNRVVVLMTDEFQSLLRESNITYMEPVKARMEQHVTEHNHEETPLFAKDIQRKALAGFWK